MEKERPAQQVAEIGYMVGDVTGRPRSRRRHDRHRRALTAAARTVLEEGAEAGDRGRHPRRLLRPRLRAARVRELGDRADRRHRHAPRSAPAHPENIAVLSTAQTLADSIRRIFTDDSVSEIFAGENQLF